MHYTSQCIHKAMYTQDKTKHCQQLMANQILKTLIVLRFERRDPITSPVPRRRLNSLRLNASLLRTLTLEHEEFNDDMRV